MISKLRYTAPIKLLVFLYRYVRFCIFTHKSRKVKQKQKIQNLISDYEKLIQEFRLIQEKKSSLSRKQRDLVQLRIAYLIQRGHIKIV